MKRLILFSLCLVILMLGVACNQKGDNSSFESETWKPIELPETHDHEWGEWVVTCKATCTNDGEETSSCDCGAKTTRTIKALGHSEVIEKAIASTCTTEGKTEGKYCGACNTVIVAQTTIPSLVHNYKQCICEFCGDIKYSVGLAYELNNDGTCYITGLGSCLNSDIYIPTYIDSHQVTGIGNYAFDGSPYLKSVGIPNTVTSIGSCAFDDCPSLTSVIIPNSVTSIDAYAFAYCKNLTTVTIPDNVTVINDMTFNGCTNLNSVTIGKGVTKINWNAFQYCTNLSKITFNGTKAQWNAITKGNNWNRQVPANSVSCSDGKVYLD